MKTDKMTSVELFETILSSWMDCREVVIKWCNSKQPTRCFVTVVRPNYFIVEQPHHDCEPTVLFCRYDDVSSISFCD